VKEKIERTVQRPSFLTNPALSLLCFGGKGGVGKTTSAAATALYLANKNPEKRIMIASIDPAHSLADSLKDTNNVKNLTVWEIDASASFRKFTERYTDTLKKIMDRGSFLDEADVCELLSISLPGIDEVMGIIELVDLIESNAYDVIVLDTAPTGHAIKFLQMPHLIRQWVHALDLMMEKHRYLSKLYLRRYQPDDADAFIEAFTKSAEKIECALQNKSCEFVPVMIPEALSVNETKRFLSVLKRRKIPVNNIIINRIYPTDNCTFCNGQYVIQSGYINEIKRCFEGYNFLLMPLYQSEVHGKEALMEFAQAMIGTTYNTHRDQLWTGDKSQRYKASLSVTERVRERIGDIKSPISPDFPLPYLPAEEEIKDLSKKELANHFPAPKPTIKLMLFSGKGGVGKTTVASATALVLADLYHEKRILLFSTDPAHSLSDSLGVAAGGEGLSIKKNLYIQEMDAEKEYRKLKQLYEEEIHGFLAAFTKRDAAVKVAFEKEIMESLMDIAPPGIDEVMSLTTIIDYMEKGSFDIFVLDTAPTGHLIRFLEMPELTLSWLKFFFNLFLKYKNVFRMPKLTAFLVDLSKNIKRLLALLRDGERSLFVPIAILTEMAYEETRDLVEAVKRLKIPVNQIILNMAQPVPQKYAGGECPVCAGRVAYERKVLNAFKNLFPGEAMYIIHRQEREVAGRDALELLGRELYGVVPHCA